MTRRERALIAIENWLADLCDRYANQLEDMARRLRRCPTCGENIWYGRSCDDMRKLGRLN